MTYFWQNPSASLALNARRNPERELILDAIDEWRRGARATPAAPYGSGLYESRMRLELIDLYRRLLKIEPDNRAAARELEALLEARR
jgi:hypothetical protein